jgi:hypothetical protein
LLLNIVCVIFWFFWLYLLFLKIVFTDFLFLICKFRSKAYFCMFIKSKRKESLNSDGQQFHQLSTERTITSQLNSLNTKNIMHGVWRMTLEIQVLAWERHKNVAGLNWLMGSQTLPSCLLDLQQQIVLI